MCDLYVLASQRGRMPCTKRTKLTEEVKRLELQGKINGDGTSVQTSDHTNCMDEIVKLLTDTKLEYVPNTAEQLEAAIKREKEFLVKLIYNICCVNYIISCAYVTICTLFALTCDNYM